MKEEMAMHKNKFLKHLYGEFENLKTVQIAVYFSQLAQYLGRNAHNCKNTKREPHKTLFVSMGFSRALFRLIIHDKKMRNYLAYRGLRSQLNSGKWGTIIYQITNASEPKGSGWRWISDEDGVCFEIKSYGQVGTWYTVYESPALKKDTNGTGVSSF